MTKELEAFIRDKRNIHLSGDYSNPAAREDSFEAGVKIILDELEAALTAAPTCKHNRINTKTTTCIVPCGMPMVKVQGRHVPCL